LGAQGGSRERLSTGAGRISDHPALGRGPASAIVTFSFDGAPVSGRDGEPIAAALFAAGIRVLRTMPGLGEPRGGFCMVGRCVDCLVVVDGRPNVRACVTPVRFGLRVETQRGLGGDADFGASEPGR
jgi:predicted molibdopterin-dependent oxidoreductase YjgC